MACKFVSPRGNVEVDSSTEGLDGASIVNLDRVEKIELYKQDWNCFYDFCMVFVFSDEPELLSFVVWRYSTEEARAADLERVLSIAGSS